MRRIIIAATVATALALAFLYSAYFSPFYHGEVLVEIPRGAGLRDIAQRLERAGITQSADLFVSYVIINGLQKKIKAGEYEFANESSVADIALKLVKGDVALRKFTIPEGLTVAQTAALLDEKGVVSARDFIAKLSDGKLRAELLGAPGGSFEGYLYPDTYSYPKGITPERLIRLMVAQFRREFELVKSSSAGANLGAREAVILASIIEKETGASSERELISSVFHNRLKRGMRLDSDPTVIYGLGSTFDGNLRKIDLQDSGNRYNTYRNTGLPPGPIANPGRESLRAALNPARSDYLYFVSKGDGTHQFSSTYEEHQRAVNLYQRKSPY
ncbi:MAG: endolytic transglycosylase MltG [Deltaproteobacteria bacterium]